MGITATDIEILRRADSITFEANRSSHQMVARLGYRNPHNRTGVDQDHVIPVYGYVVLFGPTEPRDLTTTLATNAHAAAMVSASPLTQTWTGVLRLRDEPVLVWWADNTTQELRQMDLVNDELYLAIYRNRRERSRFHVTARVTATESTDRMIRIET